MIKSCIIRGILVIATPYSSGFDHFFIADEVQFKFDRCLRILQETVSFNNIELKISTTFALFYNKSETCFCLGSRYKVLQKILVLLSYAVTTSRSSYFRHWPFFGICHPPFDRYIRYMCPVFFSISY